MLIDKYAHNMSLPRMVYCYTVLGLMKRGYGYRESKKLLDESNLLKMASSSDKLDRQFVMHYDDETWVDMCDPCVDY